MVQVIEQGIGVYRHYEKQIARSATSPWGARDSGGAIAPTTIPTYRKATAFGRIAAEILLAQPKG
jgi:hypothetical protein